MLRSYGVTAGLVSVAFGLGLYLGGARVEAQRAHRVLEIRRYSSGTARRQSRIHLRQPDRFLAHQVSTLV